MLRIQQYVKAQSLEEAYTLLTKNRNNQILGGMCWLKMEDRLIPCAIDLGDLGLDKIEESGDCIYHRRNDNIANFRNTCFLERMV